MVLFLAFSCGLIAQKKPKTNVPIIKENPPTKLPTINDADFDLLPITANEPNVNDLLDIVPSQTTVIKTPNAGTNIYDKLGLQNNFTFNKKVGFMVTSSDGDMVGHFFLNTKNGYSLLPHEALSEIVKGDGELNQIMTPFIEFFQYTKSSEGNYAMKMSSNQSSEANHDWISKENSKKFFTTFKKTGNSIKLGSQKQFKSAEYKGKDDDGKTNFVYITAANDIRIDTKKTHSLTGHWCLGYIASPSKRTYLITGIKGNGASIFMTYIENASYTFLGKNYKPVGDMMASAMQENKLETEASMTQAIAQANAEKDPKLRQFMLDQINQLKKVQQNTNKKATTFGQSSDLKDMPFLSEVNNPKATADYYDMLITTREQTIREAELSLAEAQKHNNNKAIATYTCSKNCYITELNRLQKVKAEHIKILNQFKNDDEKRDEKLNQLMQTQGIPKACDCK